MAQFQIVDCDNIRETVAIVGLATATIPLGGAAQYSNAAGSKLSNGDTSWWVVRCGAEISEGIFTYNTGTPNTLTQTAVWKSSNNNNPVTFSSGATGEAFIDLPARLAEHLNFVELTVASASTCDIGGTTAQSVCIAISGTTTITSLGTGANKCRLVRFTGALTLTHNATSLILPGGANITTVAGDTAVFASDSSGNWRCYSYQPAAAVGGQSKPINFTRDLSAATGSVSYTGVGFKPSAMILIGEIVNTASFVVGVFGSARTGESITSYNTGGGSSIGSANVLNNAILVYLADGTAAKYQTATITSWDVDGWTLAWTKNGLPTGTVNFTALLFR